MKFNSKLKIGSKFLFIFLKYINLKILRYLLMWHNCCLYNILHLPVQNEICLLFHRQSRINTKDLAIGIYFS